MLMEKPVQSPGLGKDSKLFKSSSAKSVSSLRTQEFRKIVKTIKTTGKTEHWWIEPEELQFSTASPKKGNSSKVFEARWRNLDIAVKIAKDQSRGIHMEELLTELSVWKTIRHPNITMFLGASFREDLGLMLLVERMSGGTLDHHLQTRTSFNEKTNWRVAMDICSALAFLHNCNPAIVHGDVNPKNILFNSYGQAKLADFGFSRFLFSKSSEMPKKKLSDKRYCAPEILLHLEDNTRSSDMYSYGVVLLDIFEPIKNRLNRKKSEDKELDVSIVKSTVARKLIARCIKKNPKERVSASAIIDEIESLAEKEKCIIL
mmetsp:Transcript_16416/g.19706  ORF Transcript_16416/g.19706 Transcript_16416/m.19706 type:complete len:317 (-) Transcript_16416:263-1213(-)